MKRSLASWVALPIFLAAHVGASPRKPAPSHAPEAPSLAESLAGQAKLDYDHGRILYEDGDFAGALLKFEHAYGVTPDARLLWNMAACEKNQRHYSRALGLVERYQREGAGSLSTEQTSEAAELTRTLDALVSTVHLNVDEAFASVFVDDEEVGTTPLAEPLRLDLGRHRVRVSKPGFVEQVVSQEFAGGSELTFSLALKPAPVAQGAQLAIHVNGPGVIYIDGSIVGDGNFSGHTTAGQHAVRVTASGKRTYNGSVTLREGESRSLDIALEADKSALPLVLWVGGGIVVAGALGAGAYFAFHHSPTTESPTVGSLSPGSVQLPLRGL